jgi:hypothetical protein
MAARDSLSDDWEDLGDDTLSVVSLPISDGDTTDHQRQAGAKEETATLETATPCTSNPSTIAVRQTTAVSNGIDVGHTPGNTAATLDGGQKHESLTTSTEAPPAYERSHRARVHDSDMIHNEQLDDDDTTYEATNEVLDSQVVDPSSLLGLAQSLGPIIKDSIQAIRRVPSLDEKLAEKGIIVCRLLGEQVTDLEPIIRGYVNVWATTAAEIPLDSGLQEWLSGVRVKLLRLQVEVDEYIKRGQRSDTLGSILASLESWELQMKDFLPIMQV